MEMSLHLCFVLLNVSIVCVGSLCCSSLNDIFFLFPFLWNFFVVNIEIKLIFAGCTHSSSTGRLSVMLPSVLSPYLRNPKKPTAVYKLTTTPIPIFRTPGHPMKWLGVFMLFSSGITFIEINKYKIMWYALILIIF